MHQVKLYFYPGNIELLREHRTMVAFAEMQYLTVFVDHDPDMIVSTTGHLRELIVRWQGSALLDYFWASAKMRRTYWAACSFSQLSLRILACSST